MKRKIELIKKIKKLEKEKKVITLLFPAKGKEHNNAIVLEETLKSR